jgi:hypothetical protein
VGHGAEVAPDRNVEGALGDTSLVDDTPAVGTAKPPPVADGADGPVTVDGAGVATVLAEQGGLSVARVAGRRRRTVGGAHRLDYAPESDNRGDSAREAVDREECGSPDRWCVDAPSAP